MCATEAVILGNESGRRKSNDFRICPLDFNKGAKESNHMIVDSTSSAWIRPQQNCINYMYYGSCSSYAAW